MATDRLSRGHGIAQESGGNCLPVRVKIEIDPGRDHCNANGDHGARCLNRVGKVSWKAQISKDWHSSRSDGSQRLTQGAKGAVQGSVGRNSKYFVIFPECRQPSEGLSATPAPCEDLFDA